MLSSFRMTSKTGLQGGSDQQPETIIRIFYVGTCTVPKTEQNFKCKLEQGTWMVIFPVPRGRCISSYSYWEIFLPRRLTGSCIHFEMSSFVHAFLWRQILTQICSIDAFGKLREQHRHIPLFLFANLSDRQAVRFLFESIVSCAVGLLKFVMKTGVHGSTTKSGIKPLVPQIPTHLDNSQAILNQRHCPLNNSVMSTV